MNARGHFSLDGLFQVLLAIGLFFAVPVLSTLAVIVLSVLKIWCAFSWWWLAIPVGIFVLWCLAAAFLEHAAG